MILVPIDHVKEGQILAKSIFSENGELLLAAGFHIKRAIITRMQQMEMGNVWIHQEGTEEIVCEEVVSDQVNMQAKSAIADTAEVISSSVKIREETLGGIEKQMKETKRFKNIIATPKVQKAVSGMIDDLLSKPDVVLNMNTMRTQKNYLYQHAVDVTIIAMMIGNRLRLPRAEMQELGMGCILHDIGMTVVPDSIINKEGKLTYEEFNILKEHPTYGYQILSENTSIPPVTAHIAFQHHERQDGLGYPRKLRGNNLMPIKTLTPEKGFMHRFSEITAVADTYDSMSSPRKYQQKKSPEEIIRQMILASGTQLNKAIVDVMIGLIPIFPVGSYVMIRDAKSQALVGAKAIVARVNKDALDRPLILLMKDPRGRKLKPAKVDLMQYQDIQIQFISIEQFNATGA